MPSTPLRFEDVTFDPDTLQVWRTGQLVHLSPKAFALLSLLIEQRPKPVDKEAIQRRLWPDTFVSDTNLPALVAEIREALGDDARHPRFVRTVHGVGYAFQASEAAEQERPQPCAWLLADGRELALYPGANILGREGPVVLSSTTVSRQHARIVIGDAMTIEDLDSKNGTYLNDRPVTSATAIADGDQVRTGSLLFTFRVANVSTTTETRSSRERPR